MAQTVKRLPTMQETWVQSLVREDLLEKEMATHTPVFLPGKSHGQRRLVGYSPWGHKESDMYLFNILLIRSARGIFILRGLRQDLELWHVNS